MREIGPRCKGRLRELKHIAMREARHDVVDVEASRERDIPAGNLPTQGTRSVAQMVFAHLLNLTQHVAHHAQTVKEGRWAEAPD